MTKGLKTGDTVRLKSGGPLMTVGLGEDESSICHWFTEDGQHHSVEFDDDMLEVSESKPSDKVQ